MPTKIGFHAFHVNLYLHEFFEPILFFDPVFLFLSQCTGPAGGSEGESRGSFGVFEVFDLITGTVL